MKQVVQFELPQSCSRCCALRNNEFGDFYCFITEEILNVNYLDYNIGNNCPKTEVEEE